MEMILPAWIKRHVPILALYFLSKENGFGPRSVEIRIFGIHA
jgi:hypothetical protein